MNPASDWTRDEYTLVRTEPRPLTDEEQADLQRTIRRYLCSCITLIITGCLIFGSALALASTYGAVAG